MRGRFSRGQPTDLEGVLIRQATEADFPDFVGLVTALARFEHLEPPTEAAKRRLLRDIFKKRRANLMLALDHGRAVGYALYFFTYSSFLARPTLYLEDLFVLEAYRGRGTGKRLFLRCVREAKREGCGRMEWAVLTWNSNAIRFYENARARRLDEWCYYRLDKKAIGALTSDGPPA